jgi:hypothetical protein
MYISCADNFSYLFANEFAFIGIPPPTQKKQPGGSSYTYSPSFSLKEKKQNGLPWRKAQIWGFSDICLYNQGVFFNDRSNLNSYDIPIPVFIYLFFFNPSLWEIFRPSVNWG